MKLRTYLLLTFITLTSALSAQSTDKIPIPTGLEQGYPRIYVTNQEKPELESTIADNQWAQNVVQGIHGRIDGYVAKHVGEPEWMPSRLMMNWNTKTKDVYIKGIFFSHDGGEAAPVPTVKFAGSRDYTTTYMMPSIEETMPYMDDPRGVYFPNRANKDNAFEWADPAKTGGIIVKMNERIISLARDAAFIYWLEGDEKYAKFAFDVFDVYMQGMYYRREPIDLDHGHIQTLIGFTCFQVIHESTLKHISELYDFLYGYIDTKHQSNIEGYEQTIKRWTDQIIKNGVPQNNWNLHQANIILKAAMILKDNEHYSDKKGRGYYIDYILNVTSMRQWSLTKLIDFGYDTNNGIWAECPGYSISVTNEMMRFVEDYYRAFDFDLLPYLPVMYKAVEVLPQYIFPNGDMVAFGDSNYAPISTGSIRDMIRMAQQTGDKKSEAKFTSMYRLFEKSADQVSSYKPKASIESLFESKPLEIDKKYETASLDEYITQTFYAPSVSWHVQRMGTGKDGLMASLNASLGNHMHANGINLELYGKGMVQGADPGKGTNYLQAAYLEYYSQFPAHNTVMVDGASSYTEMMSYHAFELNGEYPKSETTDGYYENLTYADVYFVEPETQSDQNRTFAIVRNSESSGYYVDVFRSKRKNGKDQFHDYYYHNLGQTMQIQDASGKPMSLIAEDKIGFAGGHLYALDYMWDEKYASTSEDYQVEWKIDYPEAEEDIFMNLWMKGSPDREIYSIQSPACKSFKDTKSFPYNVSEDPYQTFIARQYGQAWDAPFVSIYEPSTSTQGRSIESIEGFDDENGDKSFAGVKVVNKSGRQDYIFSSYGQHKAKYKDMESDASYAIISVYSDSKYEMLLGGGSYLSFGQTTIQTSDKTNVFIKVEGNKLSIDNQASAKITINGKTLELAEGELRDIKLKK